MSLRDLVTTKAIEAGGRLTVRSALNPILWLCAIVSVPAAAFLAWTDNPPLILTYLAAMPVGAALFGFLFLLLFDRDKLQSEEYQLRKSYLEMVEQKGDPAAIEAARIDIIENPDLMALPPNAVEEE